MSRAAAESGFETFLKATMGLTREEFSVARALRGTGLGPGGMAVDALREHAGALERQVVEPELATYRERALEQFRTVLDYAEGEDPIGAYESDLLDHHSYYAALKPGVDSETRDAVVEEILARNRRLGDGVAPIVARPEDEFWAAAEAALDAERATELVEEAFPFTGPVRRRPEAFAFEVRLDPAELLGGPMAALPAATIDYTDEAVRAMHRAERQVVNETTREIRERFGD